MNASDKAIISLDFFVIFKNNYLKKDSYIIDSAFSNFYQQKHFFISTCFVWINCQYFKNIVMKDCWRYQGEMIYLKSN